MNPFLRAIAEPAGPKPPNGECVCGEPLEPFALWAKWNMPSHCDLCERVNEIQTCWNRPTSWRPMFAPPTRYANASFANYRCPPGDAFAAKVAQEWRPDLGDGILFHGKPGHGKSHLAYAIANALVDDRQDVTDPAKWPVSVEPERQPGVRRRLGELYPAGRLTHRYRVEAATVPAILSTMRRQFSEGRGIDAVMDRLVLCDVLVLDDLGAENATDWAREQLFTMLNDRLDECRPTVITSNLTPGDISRRVSDGGRLASRLMLCRVVHVQATGDYRAQRSFP